jgi:hypothetical protein
MRLTLPSTQGFNPSSQQHRHVYAERSPESNSAAGGYPFLDLQKEISYFAQHQ